MGNWISHHPFFTMNILGALVVALASTGIPIRLACGGVVVALLLITMVGWLLSPR